MDVGPSTEADELLVTTTVADELLATRTEADEVVPISSEDPPSTVATNTSSTSVVTLAVPAGAQAEEANDDVKLPEKMQAEYEERFRSMQQEMERKQGELATAQETIRKLEGQLRKTQVATTCFCTFFILIN